MPDSATTGSSMKRGAGPSGAAQMICSDEIRDAVVRSFRLVRPPASSHGWAHHLYRCTYRLPRGDLRLSVYDAVDEATGTTHFAELRSELDGATSIKGMQSFGFPAFQTEDGNVVFLKDGKTLRVDASAVPAAALPAGFSAEQSAYSVAAAVLACWTE